MVRTPATLLLLALSLSPAPAAPPAAARSAMAPAPAAAIDSLVQRAMRDFHVPGVAVGIVENGEVTLARGYGLRDLGRKLPVTPATLFATGSITKSVTAAVAATLVDEGKLEWDRPVREYLPWFRLHDPAATELITIRDMLTHRSGLPRYDFLRWAVPLEREELVRRLRFLEPSAGFRAAYQYNNLMYVAAGYLEGVVAGSTWERLVEERIFTPLGMNASNTSVAESQRSPDHARPHELRSGDPREVPFYNYQRFGVGPNGAVNSNIIDILKYVAFQMSGGRAGGKQVISAAELQRMHTPQVVSGDLTTYGLGWTIEWRRGRRLISHGGAITGFTAWIGFLPDRKTGVAVLTNASTGLPAALGPQLIDHLLGLAPAARPRERSDAVLRASPRPGTRPSRELHAFGGEYRHPAFGVMRVEADDDALRLVFPARTVELKHYHYDVFTSAAGWIVQFHMDTRGEFESVSVPLEPAARPVLFTRLP